ncbi:hypothetical protein C3488_36995 [Streptomyces sp. Ru72]|nr:hypothetical protein C3488_36995 [Streptomyces sp. Ru72]
MKNLGEHILVAHPVESQLSGIERHEAPVRDRRAFSVPSGRRTGSSRRLQLPYDSCMPTALRSPVTAGFSSRTPRACGSRTRR